ncbi:efflux transporter outer membrane subunit [Roseibacillus ishigakijimensis]|nr:efflux transporter outer membrane subunit [Roseibacillus ishigakijimensis]
MLEGVRMWKKGFPAGVLLAGLALVSCQFERAVTPTLAPALAADFSGSGTEAVGERWWRAFGDGDLNSLENQALGGSFTLQVAAARLKQARAVWQQARSQWDLQLDGSAESTVLELGEGNSAGVFGLGLGASYEVDLWGRIQAEVAAEDFRMRATGEDYQAAALSLSAEVATTWFQLVEARAQQDLVRAQIATNDKVVQGLEKRFVEGQGRGVDILRQRQLVESTRERLTVAELQTGVLENELAVLLGKAPGTGSLPQGHDLPSLPAAPRTGVPVALLQRRPDVRAAFERIRAADAEVAVAIADQFPRLTLTGSTGSAADGVSALFSDWLTRLGAELVGPILDGGRRRAEVERTQAVLEESIADYRQTVIVAMREVENALVRERKQRQRIEQLETQLTLAERSSRQLQREFLNGVSEYLDVLTALDGEQDLRRTLLTARRELLEYRVALYRSLAGGVSGGKN